MKSPADFKKLNKVRKSPLGSRSIINFGLLLLLFINTTFQAGCKNTEGQDFAAAKCKEWDGGECSQNCQDGDFRFCYVDPANTHGAIIWRKHCHAVYVGRTCPPCTHVFALNFGGAMRKVSCEEFYESIARKNRDCSNCLQTITNFEYERQQDW